MTTLREAAQQALECLDYHLEKGAWGHDIEGVCTALRAALEQQNTHAEGCWSWGPAHYECACRELAKAKGWKKE